MLKVLFLTPWYPSDKDSMAGLFVQKHVEAVRAQGVDVRVIHAQTLCDTWRQWRALRREGWMPDVVQLNVIQKQGLLALWLKRRYHIPYIVVEHWSGYMPENKAVTPDGLHTRLMKRICREAAVVMPVSRPLQEAMLALGFQAQRWEQIDNVVDDFFFEENRKAKDQSPKTLLHVSCFDERAKNIKGLLHAAKMLAIKRQDWQLVLVGTGPDYAEIRAYADALQLPEGLLCWTGELTPREVAELMHQSDALVLSSRYETYGVVLAEAAAAGLPILSTPVGIAEELHALIVSQEIAQHKPGRFAEFIEGILWQQNDAKAVYADRHRFSAHTIGAQLKAIYCNCVPAK